VLVVQWTTVRAMMILATKQQLCTAQADITAAFVHAPLPPKELSLFINLLVSIVARIWC
jgi:hypothetical protein